MKQRLDTLKNELKNNQAILITGDINRLYLTGFKSSAGAVVITNKTTVFLIDFRYFEKAKNEVKHLEVKLATKLYSQITELLNTQKIEEIFIETDVVSLDTLKNLRKALSDFSISDDDKISKKIAEMRCVKSDYEISQIEKAQEITDEAFRFILPQIKCGVSEKEIALNMEFFMRKNGSEGVAFDFIVVSGKNSSLPHGVPTDKLIENGDFVTMDFGAVVNGYRSDMTRTVAVGQVTEKQKIIYETVLKAQKSALSMIKPDAICCDIDKTARDIITQAGYGDCFGHGLGHSVGLEIHENPACNTRDKTPLKIGTIMTVEPGIYIENEFGVRIEEMVVVTADGCRNLTKSPKDLIIL